MKIITVDNRCQVQFSPLDPTIHRRLEYQRPDLAAHPQHMDTTFPEESERMDENGESPRVYTRRSILGKLLLGAAAVAGSGLVLKNLLSPGEDGSSGSDTEFPPESSMFHPREDPRLDPRRKA